VLQELTGNVIRAPRRLHSMNVVAQAWPFDDGGGAAGQAERRLTVLDGAASNLHAHGDLL
jgi:hypothetical protein